MRPINTALVIFRDNMVGLDKYLLNRFIKYGNIIKKIKNNSENTIFNAKFLNILEANSINSIIFSGIYINDQEEKNIIASHYLGYKTYYINYESSKFDEKFGDAITVEGIAEELNKIEYFF